MNEVQEICRLLDERGIRYETYKAGEYAYSPIVIAFDWADQCDDYLKRITVVGSCISAEHSYLTPKMAVDAILGETCHIVDEYGDGWWECDKCGYAITCDDPHYHPCCNYCPNCGRKVVQP